MFRIVLVPLTVKLPPIVVLVAIVVTPAILTLSKFVCPSTSKSPLISADVAVTIPVILTPVFSVVNFSLPL